MSAETIDDGKIECKIDGARVHSIHLHLKKNHPNISISDYRTMHPDAPLLSAMATQRVQQAQMDKLAQAEGAKTTMSSVFEGRPFWEVFDLGNSKAALNPRGEPIMVDVMTTWDDDDARLLVPAIDTNFVFNIDLTKSVIIGFAMNMPMYFWGFHGTGKTSIFEQSCARLKRPFLRIQHTIGTEESHILGQWTVKDGSTVFNLGPLALAMMHGYVYCADEYDFAMPSVVAVYQPVLEGKALYIKDAPVEMRMIKPHPNFRFVATGNTNGGGDESGLYQGTQIQNAANYSRFSIVEEVSYMDEKTETLIVAGQAGIDRADAAQLVRYAKGVRESFAAGLIASTISPRELIAIGKIGRVRGSDWRAGVKVGHSNRLSAVDRKVCNEYGQKIFG